MTDRIICGWRVRSTLPLPETAPWIGSDRAVDISIRQGVVHAKPGKRTADVPYIETTADGSLLVDASPMGRFLVTADTIVVETALAPDAQEWRASLLGPVLAIVCYLRGTLPLHACALRVRGRVIAVAGRSGSGKSTIAAALSQRGHALITDDICACIQHFGRTFVLPSYPAMKLDRASLQAIGIDIGGMTPIGPDFEKVQVIRSQGFDPTPAPLDLVYLIEDAPEGERDVIVSAIGAEGFQRVSAEIYRPPIGRLLLAKSDFFAMATQLATNVTIRRLIRQPDLRHLRALTEAIEADVLGSSVTRGGCGL
jgi:energy-coupling factor transporter ATP-binding protein EcfA2